MIKRREADTDGLPPGRYRVASSYDTDARWGDKRDTFWCGYVNGYKVHVSETCTDAQPADYLDAVPNLITNVAITDASVPDVAMTASIHDSLARRGLLPDEHLVDSEYPSADLLVDSATRYGISLVTPMLTDVSWQARAGAGYDTTCFTVDFDNQRVTCPQGKVSASWSPARQREVDAIVVKFDTDTCRACPLPKSVHHRRARRQLTIRPRPVHHAVAQARVRQNTTAFKTTYRLRAGVNSTIRQAVAVTDTRHSRYRGLAKTHLQHVYSAVALNMICLDAYFNGMPLDRTRTSHLTRLDLALAA